MQKITFNGWEFERTDIGNICISHFIEQDERHIVLDEVIIDPDTWKLILNTLKVKDD